MKIAVIVLLTFFSFQVLIAQKVNTIDNEKICELGPSVDMNDFVDSFKDSLKLIINLHTISIGKKSEEVNFNYSGYFVNESDIIRVNKNFALRISVARVIENGNKAYLYKIHLLKKENDCWEDYSTQHAWDQGNLGTLNNGYAIGYEGTSSHIGYEGTILLE